MNTQTLQHKAILLTDLLHVIEQLGKSKDKTGLSAVIDAAQEHANAITGQLDFIADSVGLEATLNNTPVMKLFRKYLALREANREIPADTTDEDLDAICVPLHDLEDQIFAARPFTPADFAAKAIIAHGFGEIDADYGNNDFWREARDLVGMKQPA